MSSMMLGYIGNSKSEPGSIHWCKAFQIEVLNKLRNSETSVLRLKYDLKFIRDKKYYVGLPSKDGGEITEWNLFCEEDQPWGLGTEAWVIDALIEAERDETIVV